MKEITFSLFQLIHYSFKKWFNYSNTYYLENNNNYKKQIFWECGGGYWSYYCGIVKMIKETYSKEILDKIVWIGSSAGVFPVCNVEYEDDIDKVSYYVFSIFKNLPQTWYGGLNKLNTIILNKCHKEYLFLKKDVILLPKQKVFYAVLNINIIFPLFTSISFCYDFDKYKDFAETCISSHGIPFLTGPLNTTLLSHPDHNKWYIRRMDAGVFTVLCGYFFGYSLFMPYGPKLSNKVIFPHIFRPYTLINGWIHTNMEYHKYMYKLGYQDAKNNILKMNAIIL
jgi:hypothetical protein